MLTFFTVAMAGAAIMAINRRKDTMATTLIVILVIVWLIAGH